MKWLVNNWIWILVGVAFIGFHLFGHGAHAGHGKRTRQKQEPLPPHPSATADHETSDDRSKTPAHSHHDD
jgi:hypothetical protein